MEALVLDTNFISVDIVDVFDSFIWTERYFKCGDFEICTPVDARMLSVLKPEYYLWLDGSDTVMIVEGREIDTNTEDGNKFVFTGRSLESILDRRIIWTQTILTGNFQNGIQKLLNENAISPTVPERVIPNLIFEASTDPTITALTIEAQFTGDNLYDSIQTLCEEKGIGFKITLTDDNKFKFKLYSGVNRSYDQLTNPYVVFSPKFDNILNSNYIETNKALKNVTLIAGEGEGIARKTTTVTKSSGSGLSRRELFTDARDISSSVEQGNNLFDKSRINSGFINATTGAVETNASYPNSKYGEPIAVQAGTNYYISGYTGDMQYRMYNSDNSYNGNASIVVTPTVWNSPINGFIRPLFHTGITDEQLSAVQIEVGTGPTTYVPFRTLTPEQYNAQLAQRGTEKLSENTFVSSFEGQVDAKTLYKYGEDFFMGDILQIANEYSMEAKTRVIELIRSQDESGEEVYPTFSSV